MKLNTKILRLPKLGLLLITFGYAICSVANPVYAIACVLAYIALVFYDRPLCIVVITETDAEKVEAES